MAVQRAAEEKHQVVAYDWGSLRRSSWQIRQEIAVRVGPTFAGGDPYYGRQPAHGRGNQLCRRKKNPTTAKAVIGFNEVSI